MFIAWGFAVNYMRGKDEMFKELEGKEVFLLPTGNNARAGKGQLEATIKKVARVFVTIEWHGYEQKYRISKGVCYNNVRHVDGGYYVFESQKAIFEHCETKRIAGLITEKYRYQSDFAQLDFETIKKVANLLKVQL